MAFRVLQVVLILVGLLLLFAPTHLSGFGQPGYTTGVVLGLTLRLILTVLAFWGAYRMGKKARQPRIDD